ncbi:TIGR03545 family protein [Rubinisphaera italica]|uniref:TIGR03545 family protein n=1 Tax=Rubinisphaera italica TaxID=2527969 RepID=A0A5C5XDZ9_9PLAN|nr:TIGR03545 family protein [Rubinisphaera italica]TWT61277.1 hypothetical protein Pan54_20130 [Rubinisphaera italica]
MKSSHSYSLTSFNLALNKGQGEAEFARKNHQLRIQPARPSNAKQLLKKRNSLRPSIRWGYLVPRLTLAIVCWATITFGFEPLLHLVITQGASATLQTVVGIQQLNSNFFQTNLELKKIEIGSRNHAGANALEIGKVHIQLDRNALLRKKFIVDEANIDDIHWNTDSTLDFANVESEAGEWSIPFGEQAHVIGDYAKQAGQSFLQSLLEQTLEAYDPNKLETVQLAKLKESYWQDRFQSYELESKQLKVEIDSLKKQLEEAKRGNPLDKLNEFARIARKVDELVNESKRIKNEFKELPQLVRIDLVELESAKNRDYEQLRQQIDAIPLNANDLTIAIVGPEAARKFEKLSAWIPFVQKCLAVATEDYEPERQLGRTIDFDTSQNLPTFLIRQMKLNGLANLNDKPLSFIGNFQDITHNQRQYGKPMSYHFEIEHQGQYLVDGKWDQTTSTPQLEFSCHVTTDQFPTQELAKHEKLNLALQAKQLVADFHIVTSGLNLQAELKWKQNDVSFLVESPLQLTTTTLSQLNVRSFSPTDLLGNALRSINEIEGEVRISGPIKSPTLEIHSQIGKTIVAGLQQSLQKELNLRQREAFAIAQSEIDSKLDKFNGQINDQYQTLLTELNLNERLANGMIENVAIRPTSGLLDRFIK